MEKYIELEKIIMIDRFLAILFLFLFAPLMLLVTIVSFVVWGRNVFYGSPRLGLNRQPFLIFKYRTQWNWNSQIFEEYLDRRPAEKTMWLKQRKLVHDPRNSIWGIFLRSVSLDELPQLFKVIRGEMVLVGPRPIVSGEDSLYGKDSHVLHTIKTGMTGLWQISGRNLTSYHHRIAINLYYIRHKSWKLDLWILWKTIGAVISGKGAF